MRLWDALRLSETVALRDAGDSVQQEDLSPCPHQIADPQCIESCWTRLSSTNDIDSFHDPPAKDPMSKKVHFRRVILDAIIALESTGVDHEDNLSGRSQRTRGHIASTLLHHQQLDPNYQRLKRRCNICRGRSTLYRGIS